MEIEVLALARTGEAQRYMAFCGEHRLVGTDPNKIRERLSRQLSNPGCAPVNQREHQGALTMAKKPTAAAPKAATKDTVVSSAGDTDLVMRKTETNDRPVQKAGEKGPPSSLETGVGSPTGASAGATGVDFEGRRGEGATKVRSQTYSVQVHSDEEAGGLKRGLNVLYIDAESGDEAALKAREAHKANYGVSIRGVTPASDPDPNSLGGERDASIMIHNAENPLGGVDPLGTEANRKATEELGKADIEDLGE